MFEKEKLARFKKQPQAHVLMMTRQWMRAHAHTHTFVHMHLATKEENLKGLMIVHLYILYPLLLVLCVYHNSHLNVLKIFDGGLRKKTGDGEERFVERGSMREGAVHSLSVCHRGCCVLGHTTPSGD